MHHPYMHIYISIYIYGTICLLFWDKAGLADDVSADLMTRLALGRSGEEKGFVEAVMFCDGIDRAATAFWRAKGLTTEL